jgi:enoyl-CoA hydratase/carnithine racemase
MLASLLAMAADIRIASDQAKFGSFEARRGFHHGDGGLARLVNLCGVGVAMAMALTAELIDAHRALQINLVSKVVPHDRLMEATKHTARTILRNDQAAVRSAKQVILDMIGRSLDDQLYKEAIAAYTLMANNPTVPGLLKKFYEKKDKGRHGVKVSCYRRRSRSIAFRMVTSLRIAAVSATMPGRPAATSR